MTRSRSAYNRAMEDSGDLIDRMRGASRSNHIGRAVTADIWAWSENIPFMTTVYEAVEEMKSPMDQKAERKSLGK
jgi:hypothetical protein